MLGYNSTGNEKSNFRSYHFGTWLMGTPGWLNSASSDPTDACRDEDDAAI
jgi:hypothetical protein